MNWAPFSHGVRLDPIVKRSPDALVVVLHDTAAMLTPIVTRWAKTVPTTAFVLFDRMDQHGPPTGGLSPEKMVDGNASTEPTALDRAVRHLDLLLEQQLRSCRLDASRLVLVGFGYGGTLALHMLLRQGRSCAGFLAFTAKLTRPLPRLLRVDKVRLIECAGDGPAGRSRLRDVVALLNARGIDTRGISLAGPALSDEAIRHGGAYLVELVATAQRAGRFTVDRESGHAR